MRAGIMAATLASGVAHAGSGPWVLGQGDEQIYVGLDTQRFTTLAIGDGAYTDSTILVDDGIMTFGAVAIASIGLPSNLEIEAEIPFVYNWAPNPGAVCELLGADACEPTSGIGTLATRIKWLALDELAGKPISLSIGLDLRFGQLASDARRRITAISEGTFALEPRLSIGHIGSLPGGSWSIYGSASVRYHLPTDPEFSDTGLAVPGFDVFAQLETLFTPTSILSIGPVVNFYTRPMGVDFLDTDFGADDRINALKVLALEAGGKLILRNNRAISGAIGVTHTLYAINNPQDVLKISVGVGFRDLVRKRPE